MSDTITLRVPGKEKEDWQSAASQVNEEFSDFIRKAVRQRVHTVQQKGSSPWDKYLGTVKVPAGRREATNANIRKLFKDARSSH